MDTPAEGEFLSFYSIADYEAAIQKAPPGTLIKLGDLDANIVTCTTCNGKMTTEASKFHKHPKKCGGCGEEFDENMERHEPQHNDVAAGAGTLGFSTGCKKVAL